MLCQEERCNSKEKKKGRDLVHKENLWRLGILGQDGRHVFPVYSGKHKSSERKKGAGRLGEGDNLSNETFYLGSNRNGRVKEEPDP